MANNFFVRLRGVSFSNTDGVSRQDLIVRCKRGEPLILRAEPSNPHDRHAVAVTNARGEQLGWLPSDARDASAVLRGEPIKAYVERVTGGTKWWHRLSGLQRSYGLIIRLVKDAVDWTRFNAITERTRPIDAMVQKAQQLERLGNTASAIEKYHVALQAIIELNHEDPTAAAHRFQAAPINRLSILLVKAGRKNEALAAIRDWRSVPDPVGLSKSEQDAVLRREAKLLRQEN